VRVACAHGHDSGREPQHVDGHDYVDLCLGDTGAMTGHSPAPTVATVRDQVGRGITAMLPTEDSVVVAEELRRRFGLPLWQFTLSATDANRHVIRYARHLTGRRKIVVHDFCYHGSVDETFATLDADGRTTVKARANASASGLVHALDIDPQQYPLLSWQWKVDDLIKTADNTTRHLEDSPVRVVVSFAGDIDNLPLDDRMFFDNVRLLTRQQLPYATLMYIWENRAPRDSVLPNLHTSRIKMIVAESGRDHVGTWQEVTRNVVEDYQRAFGEAPGRITAIAVMTDTDNTGENAQAWYGDILFRRIAPPRSLFVTD